MNKQTNERADGRLRCRDLLSNMQMLNGPNKRVQHLLSKFITCYLHVNFMSTLLIIDYGEY